MLQRFLAFYLAAFASLLISNGAIAQDAAKATVVVFLPDDAKLYFDGGGTQQTGTARTFTTPPIKVGSELYYQLKAEVVRDGKKLTQTKKVPVRGGETTHVDFTSLSPEAAPAADESLQALPTDGGWPRRFVSDGNTITVYQPQVEKWEGNQLAASAAVSVETKASPLQTFGVIWITARTSVDKEHRQVTLDDFKIAKANFPTAPDRADEYLAILRPNVFNSARTIALDRIEANLAVTQAAAKTKTVAVKNDPPRILFSTKPALLVLIDGKPVQRQVPGSTLLRVINTRNLVLFDQAAGKYYLRLMDRWMTAAQVEGPWSVTAIPPAALDKVLKSLGANPQVDLLDNLAADIKEALENGTVPVIYTSTTPAELIETDGEPQYAPIEGTKVLWAKNSTNPILLDTSDQNQYVLLSGRWFRSKTLKGPWEFVPANKLPADFAKIPESHPRGDVLGAVASTPQAQQAIIANNVPQMATIVRAEATLEPIFDGLPKFEPIENTPLQYTANSPTPIIRVDAKTYYAVENGVWFTAPTPNGPWEVATSVPAVIYTIPTSSPLYYVTHAYVYGSTADDVYVGYTPGYFGTVVSPDGVVVYGTGWAFQPWIGDYWYGRPWTYGWGVNFGWTPGGWGFGFGAAYGRPWWGPIGWHAGWGGSHWREGWHTGWGDRYASAHINHVNFANANIYNRWNDRARPTTVLGGPVIHRGLNNVVAGQDGNVFRRGASGTWEQNTAKGWQPYTQKIVPPSQQPKFQTNVKQLNADWSVRRVGETKTNVFRATTGYYVGPVHQPTVRSVQPAIRPVQPAVRPVQPTFRPVTPPRTGPAAFHPSPGGFRGTPARHR